jgi:two-component system KDP operon response regulator KdpE
MMADPAVLIISHDPDLGALVSACIRMAEMQAMAVSGVDDGLACLLQAPPDAIVLDVGRPSNENWQTVLRIRELSAAPLILLTGAAEPSDLIQGLDCEGLYAVQKPFGPQALATTVRTSVQHVSPAQDKLLTYDDGYLTIDLSHRQVCVAGVQVALTPIEQRLLACLLRRAGQPVAQPQLVRSVWGWSGEGSPIKLHAHLRLLRQKLEPDPSHPQYIQSQGEAGYRFQGQAAPHRRRCCDGRSPAPNREL